MPTKAPEADPWTKGRPTLYKGIRMRSRLEADYAAYLDGGGYAWEYEPECFANETGQWLPDFRVDLKGKSRSMPIYVEVKPAGFLDEWNADPWPPIGHETEAGPYYRIGLLLRKMEVALQAGECVLWLQFWDYGGSGRLMLEYYQFCNPRKPGEFSQGQWTARAAGVPLAFAWPSEAVQRTLWWPGMVAAKEEADPF